MRVCFKSLVLASLIILALSFVPSLKAIVPQYHLSAIDPSTGTPIVIPKSAPISTTWHELYPDYSRIWHLTSWEDSDGDGKLSASDQIDMTEEENGGVKWFHVDWVSGYLTRHFTWKEPAPPGFDLTVPVSAEPDPEGPPPSMAPIGSEWHMIYPQFCRTFEITSWEDTDGFGDFNPSDQFDITFTDDGTGPWWAHLDAVSTDLTLTEKAPPVPEFSLVEALGLGFLATTVFLWWKRKLPKVSTT